MLSLPLYPPAAPHLIHGSAQLLLLLLCTHSHKLIRTSMHTYTWMCVCTYVSMLANLILRSLKFLHWLRCRRRCLTILSKEFDVVDAGVTVTVLTPLQCAHQARCRCLCLGLLSLLLSLPKWCAEVTTRTLTHTRIQTLAHIQQRRSHWPAEVSDLICDRHLLTVWLVSMQTTTAAAAAGEQSVWAAAQSLLALLLFNQLKNKLHSWKCSQSRKMLSETLLSYYTPLQLALHLLF